METTELHKLATCGDFVVAKVLCKTNPRRYILKRMVPANYITWECYAVVSTKYDLQINIELLSHTKPFIYMVKERPSLSDLQNFSLAGFRVLKILHTKSYVIKEFCLDTKKWRNISSFEKKFECIFFLRKLEEEENILLIN